VICPNCGTEYREGFTHCTDCDVDLIEPPPPPEPPPQIDLVQVFESGNPALIPVIESLFEDAGIEYMTKSEPIQHLFGWGTFGSNLNYVIGPVQFLVRAEDAEQARALITPLDPSDPGPSDEGLR
jgi:hypothetical protein